MDVKRKWSSQVFIEWAGVHMVEERRPFRESYYRVIEIANQYIAEWFKIYKFNWSQLHLINWNPKEHPCASVLIWHSNWVDMKWNTYVNRVREE